MEQTRIQITPTPELARLGESVMHSTCSRNYFPESREAIRKAYLAERGTVLNDSLRERVEELEHKEYTEVIAFNGSSFMIPPNGGCLFLLGSDDHFYSDGNMGMRQLDLLEFRIGMNPVMSGADDHILKGSSLCFLKDPANDTYSMLGTLLRLTDSGSNTRHLDEFDQNIAEAISQTGLEHVLTFGSGSSYKHLFENPKGGAAIFFPGPAPFKVDNGHGNKIDMSLPYGALAFVGMPQSQINSINGSLRDYIV
ncbi:hypothetical protein JW968_02940 [Candidatus Woesearchaeota archaeon]|nr:hypothetical protein [Candidatus Woesearchaeota archaeon]